MRFRKNVDGEDDYATCSLIRTIVQGHQRVKAKLTAGSGPEIIMCESVSWHHRVRTEALNCRPSASSGPLYSRRAMSACTRPEPMGCGLRTVVVWLPQIPRLEPVLFPAPLHSAYAVYIGTWRMVQGSNRVSKSAPSKKPPVAERTPYFSGSFDV